MSIRVGINGLGRVGRSYRRRAAQSDDLEVVAVNDVADTSTMKNLLRRESTFGRFEMEVTVDDEVLLIDGRKVAVSAIRDPEQLPWAAHRRPGLGVHREVPHARSRRWTPARGHPACPDLCSWQGRRRDHRDGRQRLTTQPHRTISRRS